MAASKYFSGFAGTKGFTLFIILLVRIIGGVVGGITGFIGYSELGKHNVMHIENPTIKTIQSEDGDIIDCVDIQRQPALNHPLLKKHSIQMRPSFFQSELDSKLSSKQWPVKQIWQQSGSCPVGTVPILRNIKESLSKAFPIPSSGGLGAPPNVREEYIAALSTQGAPYYGGRAKQNVWPMQVESDGLSLNFMEIVNSDQTNFARIGWGSYPTVFGDNQTRSFLYWTADNETKTGCYNLNCPGFVQVSNKIVLGGTLTQLSSYNGVQYVIDISIIKDDAQSSWWVIAFGEKVGYWPFSIFSDLKEAPKFAWGGLVYNRNKNGIHTSTQLGSGHFPQEGHGKAAFMYNMQTMNSAHEFVTPDGIIYIATNPGCYNISSPTDIDAPGASMYYGGPGGSGCG